MRRAIGWKHGLVAAALAALMTCVVTSPAHALDQPPPVSCPPGPSCYLWVISHGGGGEGGTIPVVPPPCPWDAVGNVQVGSKDLVNSYDGNSPAENAPDDQYVTYQQAETMIASDSTQKGEWYERQDVANQSKSVAAECAGEPRWFFAVPGEPLPGGTEVPVALAEVAEDTLHIPGAGKVDLNPVNGPTYTNLPTFVRVAFNRTYEIGSDGDPYVTATIAVEGDAATVWVIGEPLVLTTSESDATLFNNGCGYLGSIDMMLKPKEVASTGANGQADCGVTFHEPGTWTITATMAWRTCWVPEEEFGPPPTGAACTPVPNANLNPDVWDRVVDVHEIQAANGSD